MIFSLQFYFISNNDIPRDLKIDDNAEFIFTNHGNNCVKHGFCATKGNIFELSIKYEDEIIRNSIIDLFCAAYTVIHACNYYDFSDLFTKLKSDTSFSTFEKDDRIYLVCLLVQKCYNNQCYKNAICKYHVAQEIFSLHPLDLHPSREPINITTVLTENIRIANVVVDCYSILEELGLQIKLDSKNESSVSNDGKSWNPAILDKLKDTLKSNNINPESSIPWLCRNGITRPFKDTIVDAGNPCEWNDGDAIKDFNIIITDAILELSYMRSRLASHGLNDRVLKLTIYDAENSFNLSRIILLNFFEITLE